MTTNIKQSDLDNLHSKLFIGDFPPDVIVETTTACNYKCTMCHNNSMTRKSQNVKPEVWDKVIDELSIKKPNTKFWLTFYGEALILFDKVLYGLQKATDSGVKNTYLNTNGSLMTNEKFEKLYNAGLKHLVYSVDGYSKDVYEKIRIGGNRDKVYQNIINTIELNKKLGENINIEVQMIELNENSFEKEVFIDFWKKQGVIVKVKKFLNWTETNKSFSEYINNFQRIGCPWAFQTFVVLANGDVPTCGCDYDAKFIYGNIFEESIESLWNKRKEHLNAHLDKEFNKLPNVCQNCTDWFIAASDKI